MGGVREEGASGKEEGCGALLGGVEWVHEKVRWRGSRGGGPRARGHLPSGPLAAPAFENMGQITSAPLSPSPGLV